MNEINFRMYSEAVLLNVKFPRNCFSQRPQRGRKVRGENQKFP